MFVVSNTSSVVQLCGRLTFVIICCLFLLFLVLALDPSLKLFVLADIFRK